WNATAWASPLSGGWTNACPAVPKVVSRHHGSSGGLGQVNRQRSSSLSRTGFHKNRGKLRRTAGWWVPPADRKPNMAVLPRKVGKAVPDTTRGTVKRHVGALHQRMIDPRGIALSPVGSEETGPGSPQRSADHLNRAPIALNG